ncbi:MAG: Type II secretion system protein G [candidate division WS2 bacterium]|uniref:Type II secretion system protein G n=1 Tax=Psychracetigena formicireducens TaxID=2986056 RepID=A0A9E2BF95_PSYF1|nr:Type II secretion system protein G [Candidatus Psychracetigena formicireducens]MBT9144437.1 Type II secretion system protein G [Candidatus Psychracetigena formicireducens]MBT9150073.1 Type II secretion system protein G [Candidatus Psychracetigena formicireducens]
MKSKGFTLIELIMVMAIIVTLAGVLIPRLMGARLRAQVAVAIVELRAISIALEQYAIDQGNYPEPAELTEFKTGYLGGEEPFWPWDRNDRILVADIGLLEYTVDLDRNTYLIEKELPAQIRGIAGLMSGYSGLEKIALTPERGVHFLPLPP